MSADFSAPNLSDIEIKALLAGIDRMESAFVIYDKNYRLIWANTTSHDAWPDLYGGLQAGLPQREAIHNEIVAQMPDLSGAVLKEAVDYAANAFQCSQPQDLSARGGRIFQTFHQPLGDVGIVAIGVDVTELKSNQHKLRKLVKENYALAYQDELTGLFNRRKFISEIEQLIADRADCETPFALGLLDLDGFKLVNDVYGHPVGDSLLIEVAERLKGVLGETVKLARLGGDEFGLILDDISSSETIRQVGADICASIAEPFGLGNDLISVSTSVGFATFPKAGIDRAILFKRADFAMYHAKQHGKGKAIAFSSEHEATIHRRALLELQIKEADFDAEVYPVFQPIFNSRKQIIVGVEALARWQNAVLGNVSPDEFIPAAEQSGQIARLTPVMLRKALAIAKDWPIPIFLTFNLSALEVTSADYAHQLLAIIENSGFTPDRVVFEITETAMIRDTETVAEVLSLLQRHGIRIALDDFGTGFSSLSMLSQMPLDYLKIDRSFLDGIEQKRAVSAVFKSICDLSRHLGITSIVEGVETEAQMLNAHVSGIDLMQGYLLGRPMPADQITEFIVQNNKSPSSLPAHPQKLGMVGG